MSPENEPIDLVAVADALEDFPTYSYEGGRKKCVVHVAKEVLDEVTRAVRFAAQHPDFPSQL